MGFHPGQVELPAVEVRVGEFGVLWSLRALTHSCQHVCMAGLLRVRQAAVYQRRERQVQKSFHLGKQKTPALSSPSSCRKHAWGPLVV